MIGFIQIKGRARNSDSASVLLETEGEMALHKYVENQEETMRMLLKQRSQYGSSELSKHILEDIKI